MKTKRVPVTVVTGFLGAGKTTLVNHLLAAADGGKVGVVVNEFGEVGIDGQLIAAQEEALVEISNGCVCCTVRKDLVASVAELLERADDLERLVVETSGMADPAPVLQSFLADPVLRERVELESVVVLVDACHFDGQLADQVVREQVAFADLIVLNKCSLAGPATVDRQRAAVRGLNSSAQVIAVDHAQVPPDRIFGVRRFSLPDLLVIEPDLLDEEGHDHQHDSSIQSFSLLADGALDPLRFNRWANRLVQDEGRTLMRMKGVLHLQGEARRFHFHSVHMLIDALPGRAWRGDEDRTNRFVFIGRALDAARLREGFLDCLAA